MSDFILKTLNTSEQTKISKPDKQGDMVEMNVFGSEIFSSMDSKPVCYEDFFPQNDMRTIVNA